MKDKISTICIYILMIITYGCALWFFGSCTIQCINSCASGELPSTTQSESISPSSYLEEESTDSDMPGTFTDTSTVDPNSFYGTATPVPTPEEEIVYWTPNGKKYHRSYCMTLSRSDVIESGSVDDAYAAGKDAPCKVCFK